VSCAETAEPIALSYGFWIRMGRRKHKFNRICQVPLMCQHGRAHWRHLANMIQLSVCGGDAVLCQLTLTTCFAVLLLPMCCVLVDVIVHRLVEFASRMYR